MIDRSVIQFNLSDIVSYRIIDVDRFDVPPEPGGAHISRLHMGGESVVVAD